MNIRRATVEDIDAIMAHLSQHIGSCKVRYPDPDKQSVAQTILSSFHHTSPKAVFVAECGGEVVGLAHVSASVYPFAPIVNGFIWLVYVAPEHRGGRAFASLMNAVYAWAAEKQCHNLSWTLSAGIDDEGIAACLEKRGWNRVGIDLVKGL